jgi:hypothetical protein
MERSVESFFDYASHGFIMPLTIDGLNMYACVNSEMVYDEGLAVTGSYYIYLLHPKHGSSVFKIEQDLNGQWFSDDAPSFIDEDLINQIGVEIVGRKK